MNASDVFVPRFSVTTQFSVTPQFYAFPSWAVCKHPGCSGKHLWFPPIDFLLLVGVQDEEQRQKLLAKSRRKDRARRLRVAGHKHARAAYRRARALKGDAKCPTT